MNPVSTKHRFDNVRGLFSMIAACCIYAWLAETACAQTPSEEGTATETQLTGDAFGADWMETGGLTGGWGGVRQNAEDAGLVPYAVFTGEFLANVSGGYADGSAWAGLLDFGLEADLDKLVGWTGGGFFVNAFYFHGNDVSGSYVGDFNAVSNIYTGTEFNVFNIYFRQGFRDDRYWFKLGQIAVDDDFMVSESALLFINSAFGPLPTESGNIAAPIYSLAAPGALVYAEPVENWFIQTAIYAGDAGPAQSSNHGFDWRTGGSAGWAWFGEVGTRYDLAAGGVIKIGGYYATGEFTDYATDVNERGLGSVYGVIDQQVLAAEGDGPGLSVFVRGGLAPDNDLVTVSAYVDGGVVLSDLLLDGDAFGVAVSQTFFGDEYLNATRAGGTPVTSSETVIEATYQFKLTEWLAVQPDLQYVFDPHYSDNDALIIGVRAELAF
ncbi:MAG: carbohydrate porin [Puniceicoccales bacterium]